MAENDESATPGAGRLKIKIADNVCELNSSAGIRVPERRNLTIRDNTITGAGDIPIT